MKRRKGWRIRQGEDIKPKKCEWNMNYSLSETWTTVKGNELIIVTRRNIYKLLISYKLNKSVRSSANGKTSIIRSAIAKRINMIHKWIKINNSLGPCVHISEQITLSCNTALCILRAGAIYSRDVLAWHCPRPRKGKLQNKQWGRGCTCLDESSTNMTIQNNKDNVYNWILQTAKHISLFEVFRWMTFSNLFFYIGSAGDASHSHLQVIWIDFTSENTRAVQSISKRTSKVICLKGSIRYSNIYSLMIALIAADVTNLFFGCMNQEIVLIHMIDDSRVNSRRRNEMVVKKDAISQSMFLAGENSTRFSSFQIQSIIMADRQAVITPPFSHWFTRSVKTSH